MTKKDPFEVVHGSLTGYRTAEVGKRMTGESLVVRMPDGQDEVLKTFNSFKRLSNHSVAPIAGDDLNRLVPGLKVSIKRGADGQLTGIFDELAPRKWYRLFAG